MNAFFKMEICRYEEKVQKCMNNERKCIKITIMKVSILNPHKEESELSEIKPTEWIVFFISMFENNVFIKWKTYSKENNYK